MRRSRPTPNTILNTPRPHPRPRTSDTLTALRAGLEAASLNGNNGSVAGGVLSRSWSSGTSSSGDAGKVITDAMESVVQQIVELCVESCNNKGLATGTSRRQLPMYLNFLTSMCADTSRSSQISNINNNSRANGFGECMTTPPPSTHTHTLPQPHPNPYL